ncbi:DUF106 domain-containing protein [Candidatus Bathyarchaeota archaeon]|nr:MAG: DUF106 domain-containing protein [Candidatus Bathyarchaeota archaeon]
MNEMTDSVFLYSIAVFAASFVIAMISMIINQRLLNQEQVLEWRREINLWNEEKKRSEKLGDKKLLAKLKRREKRILQIQSRMLKKQMIILFLNMALFWGIWQILVFYLGNKPVAYLPFCIPFISGTSQYTLNLFYWYIVCSLMSTIIASRILRVPLTSSLPEK